MIVKRMDRQTEKRRSDTICASEELTDSLWAQSGLHLGRERRRKARHEEGSPEEVCCAPGATAGP